MRGRHADCTKAMVTLVGIVALSGCGGDNTGTPITSQGASVSFRSALLRAREVANVPGAPTQGFEQQPVDQAGITVDPDPRAPCGAKITHAPALQKGALAYFASPSQTTVIQWVNRLQPGRAASLVRQDEADAQAGCPEYQSLTNTGSQQTNQFAGAVRLSPSLAAQGFVYRLRLRQASGQWISAVEISLERRNCLMYIIVFSAAPPSQLFVHGLATAASKRLNASPVTC